MNCRALAIAIVPLLLAACAARSDVAVEPGVAMAKFKMVEVAPARNETGDPGHDPVAATFRDDLVNALVSAGVQVSEAGPPAATLIAKPALVHYESGSALSRWVLPGSGRTQATVAVSLIDKSSGDSVGDLAATDQVWAGGLYTIGQDRLILSRLAGSIADEIKARL
ncbi:MAG TPA: DUF4410 domain-containing protein [Candidatus Acidoferrales bacterium]|nr:DUF4410 domain-containing protein [Candidatus Acidoferrales bacterium]